MVQVRLSSPSLQHLHCSAKGREKQLFIGMHLQRSPTFGPGARVATDSVCQPVSSQPAVPARASHPWEERSRWEMQEKLISWLVGCSVASWSHCSSRLLESCVHSVADHCCCLSYEGQVSALIFPPRGATFASSCHILGWHKHPIKVSALHGNARFMLHKWLNAVAGITPCTELWSSFFSYLPTVCLQSAFYRCCRS